jgi:YD repeat-containing protein
MPDGGFYCPYLVGTAEQSECFLNSGSGGYVPRRALGGSLTSLGSGLLSYTTRNGDQYTIDQGITATGPHTGSGVITKIERAGGLTLTLTWQTGGITGVDARLISVDASNGYSMKYEYASDAYANPTVPELGSDWYRVIKLTAYNRAVENCASTANHCSFTQQWRTVNYNWQSLGTYVGLQLTVVEPSSVSSVFRLDPVHRVVGFRPAGTTSEQITYTYCRAPTYGVPSSYWQNYGDPCTIMFANGSVQVIEDGVKWAIKQGRQFDYQPRLSFGGCGCYYYNISTDPDGRQLGLTTFTNAPDPLLLIVSDARKGETFNFEQTDTNPLLSFTREGEAKIAYKYDARGNLTESRQLDGTDPGPADLLTTASYPSDCTYKKTCNKPVTVTDPRSNTTTYSYHSDTGFVESVTAPAVNQLSSQTRHSYEQRFASYVRDDGVLGQASTPIWLLRKTSICRTSNWTGSVCAAGAADETLTEYEYGPATGANNLLLRGVVVTADGLSRRTCYGYDRFGNRISETQPKAGLAICN